MGKNLLTNVTEDDVSTSVERLEVESISGHQISPFVVGRGGTVAVLYQTNCKGTDLFRPSWEREMSSTSSRTLSGIGQVRLISIAKRVAVRLLSCDAHWCGYPRIGAR